MPIEYSADGLILVNSDDGFLYSVNVSDAIINYGEYFVSEQIVELTQKIHTSLYGVDGYKKLDDS